MAGQGSPDMCWGGIAQRTRPGREAGPQADPRAPFLSPGTRPPVDLYCYYLFLQREGSEDTLDFWLDVQQHENLCASALRMRPPSRTH